MERGDTSLRSFGKKYPEEAKVEQHHAAGVLEATVIAAALNHIWCAKGKEDYDALRDAEAVEIIMVLFFNLKVEVNFNGLAKIAIALKAKEDFDLCFEKGRMT